MKYFKSDSHTSYFRYDPQGTKTVEIYLRGRWQSTHYVDEEDVIRCFSTFEGIITSITEEEITTYLTMRELIS